jgi:hypothetical protein
MKNKIISMSIFAVLVVLLSICGFASADSPDVESFFEFNEIAGLGVEIDKAFVGRDGENLLVLGGFKMQDLQPVASNAVFVLSADSKQWTEFSQLQNHIYGGVAVSNSDGVICIGGFKDGELSKEVVRYSIEEGKLQTEQMPDLPVVIADVKAALVSGRLYAIGSEVAFSMDLLARGAKWQQLDSWQATQAKIVSVAAVAGRLYVFTQDDSFKVLRYSSLDGFEQVGETDYDLTDTPRRSASQP